MKKLYFSLCAFLLSGLAAQAQSGMGIGTNSPAEQLDVVGAIKIGTDINNGTGAPAGGAGTIRYKSNTYEGWDGSQWVEFGGGSGSDADWTISGNDIYNANSGNVGIGTSSPVNLLHVQNNASGLNFPLFLRNSSVTPGDGVGVGFLSEPNGNWTKAGIYYERTGGFGVGKLHFLVDNGADNQSVTTAETRMTIAPWGDVGIGETNPSGALHVKRNQNSQTAIVIENTNTGALSTERISFNNEDGGVAGIATYDNDSGSYPNQMRMFNNRPNGEIDLENGSGNIRLDENGNVGIGIDNPTLAKLQIAGNIRSYDVGLGNSSNTDGAQGYANYSSDNHASMVVGQNVYSNGGVLRIANTHGSLAGSGLFIPGNGQPGQGNIYFYATPTGAVTAGTAIGGTAAAEMVLTTNGRLGIGTTAPAANLHVNGIVKITGGSPGAGKVLTSDTDGDATWESPATATYGREVLSGFYTLANNANWQASGLSITVPSAGTYRIFYTASGRGHFNGSVLSARLYNVTGNSVLTDTDAIIAYGTNGQFGFGSASAETFVSVSSATTFRLEVKSNIAQTSNVIYGTSVDLGTTLITYVKISN